MRSCATADRSFKFPSTWAWQSIKPRNTVKPVRSTTRTFPAACWLTVRLGPISTTVAPLIRIAWSFAIELLLMSIRRVVLIRIGSLGGEAANGMPTAIKENRPARILWFIIPPRNRHVTHRAGVRTADPILQRAACKFGQDTRRKSAPLYLLGSKVASFCDGRDVIGNAEVIQPLLARDLCR